MESFPELRCCAQAKSVWKCSGLDIHQMMAAALSNLEMVVPAYEMMVRPERYCFFCFIVHRHKGLMPLRNTPGVSLQQL